MAQPWVTGPVEIWAAAQTPSASFLGYGEQAPDIDLHPEYDEVFCDVSGSKIPFDKLDEGEWGTGAVLLTYWDQAVLTKLQSRPRVSTAATEISVAGTRQKGEIGTLLLTEGYAYSVWYKFPYATLKPAMVGMPAGYRFPGSFLFGPDRRKSGTKANKIGLTLIHLPVYTRASGDFLLYDNNMSGIGTPTAQAEEGPVNRARPERRP